MNTFPQLLQLFYCETLLSVISILTYSTHYIAFRFLLYFREKYCIFHFQYLSKVFHAKHKTNMCFR